MSKLFDVNNLQFGDKLKTRNGKCAVYLKTDNYDGYLLIAVKHMLDNCYINKYKIKDDILIEAFSRLNSDTDIIEYWED